MGGPVGGAVRMLGGAPCGGGAGAGLRRRRRGGRRLARARRARREWQGLGGGRRVARGSTGARTVRRELDGLEVDVAWPVVLVDDQDVGHLAVAEADGGQTGAGAEFAVAQELDSAV